MGFPRIRAVGPSPRVPSWRSTVNPVVGFGLFGTLWRVRREGRSRVPETGPVLFVGNHIGFLDGPMLPAYCPRRVSVLIKREMFTGVLGWFLGWIGHIPITRDAGDRDALAAAVAVLKGGGAVGIFPEGSRGRGDVANVQQGAAWLALQTGATIVPVAFLGTRTTGRSTGSLPPLRTRMVMAFGEPLDLVPDPALTGRQRLAAASTRVQQVLAAHVAESAAAYGVGLPDDDGVRRA